MFAKGRIHYCVRPFSFSYLRYQKPKYMKQKFLLSLLFVCSLVVSTRAQINKGAIWLGGQASFNQSSERSLGSPTANKTTGFYINPAIGKAVKENLVVGISVGYSHSKNKTGSTTNSNFNSYGGGVFIRKYIPVISNLYLFGDARLNVSRGIEKGYSSSGNIKNKYWNIAISATPGIAYAVTPNIQIESGVNSLFSAIYQKRDSRQGVSEGKSSSFNSGILLDNNTPLYIGFRFLLNKKA
jgi:hypothetical protein